jgi:transposase-like protein
MEAILNQVLNVQVAEQAGAQPYDRSEERKAYRKGYRDREMKTRIVTLTLSVPHIRNEEFSIELCNRYQRSEPALVIAMMDMLLNRVHTRKVSAATEELRGTTFSKSTVSSL